MKLKVEEKKIILNDLVSTLLSNINEKKYKSKADFDQDD